MAECREREVFEICAVTSNQILAQTRNCLRLFKLKEIERTQVKRKNVLHYVLHPLPGLEYSKQQTHSYFFARALCEQVWNCGIWRAIIRTYELRLSKQRTPIQRTAHFSATALYEKYNYRVETLSSIHGKNFKLK